MGLLGGMAISGLLPRPLAWAGLAIAGLRAVTVLALIWPLLGPILPIARVSALAWLVLAGARLPLPCTDIRRR